MAFMPQKPNHQGKQGKQGKQDQGAGNRDQRPENRTSPMMTDERWRDSGDCLEWTATADDGRRWGAKGEIQLHVCGRPQCSIMQLILTAAKEIGR